MSLADAEQRALERTCRFIEFFYLLDEADQSTLSRWLEEKKPIGWIARVASSDGKRLVDKTLSRHLKDGCSCPAGTKYKDSYCGI